MVHCNRLLIYLNGHATAAGTFDHTFIIGITCLTQLIPLVVSHAAQAHRALDANTAQTDTHTSGDNLPKS